MGLGKPGGPPPRRQARRQSNEQMLHNLRLHAAISRRKGRKR